MAAVTYRVVELFETVQGEGVHAGRPATFVRFAGCNAWDGNPEHRARGRGACAAWCDTEFRHGEPMTADAIARAVTQRFVVLTGGEPLLQVDTALIETLQAAGCEVAVETNGSVEAPQARLYWIACSPKRGMPLVLAAVNELKVVLPGGRSADGSDGWTDDDLDTLAHRFPAAACFVQPQDPTDPETVGRGYLLHRAAPREEYERHVQRCLSFVLQRPRWRVGVQAHKLLGVR